MRQWRALFSSMDLFQCSTPLPIRPGSLFPLFERWFKGLAPDKHSTHGGTKVKSIKRQEWTLCKAAWKVEMEDPARGALNALNFQEYPIQPRYFPLMGLCQGGKTPSPI